ncbi:TlpA family protein disulfide reductase [Lacinutrix undariae]
MNKIVLCFFLGLFPILGSGQVNVGEFVQNAKTNTHQEQALYFIDFWATWCIPCVPAQEYLGVMQKQNPDNFYIVSMSNENGDKVERYLKKYPTDLAVVLDYNNENFTKYKVRSLPHGVLLNYKGELLWEGNPANFKQTDLNRFLKRADKTVKVDSFFREIKNEVAPKEVTYIPTKEIEFIKLSTDNNNELDISNYESYTQVTGSLQEVISYYFKVNKNQIVMPTSLNEVYTAYVSKNIEKAINFQSNFLTGLDLEVENRQGEGKVLVLDFETPTLWNTQQIDWGTDSEQYLINDSEIQADNASIKDVMYQLSLVLEMPVISKQELTDNELHDWIVHYRFYNLMQANLFDNYGVKSEIKQTSFPIYQILKKAP